MGEEKEKKVVKNPPTIHKWTIYDFIEFDLSLLTIREKVLVPLGEAGSKNISGPF